MDLQYIPLLSIQRELQGLPLGYARFQQYLRTMLNDDEVQLAPLALMNPMGKGHVTELLDAYLAIDADRIAADKAAHLSRELVELSGTFKIGLVIADDLAGGWTNRYDYEFKFRFGASDRPMERDPASPSGFRLPRWLKDFWFTGVLWSSEPASERAVREAILLPVLRFNYVLQHGPAQTLRDMMTQEGHVMAAAGCEGPLLDEDDLAYTREVLAPFLDADDKRTVIECLFGDAAGRTLGFTPRGLSHWAGLALALHDAKAVASCPR